MQLCNIFIRNKAPGAVIQSSIHPLSTLHSASATVQTLDTIRTQRVCRGSIINRAQTMMKGDVKGNPLIYRGKAKYNHDMVMRKIFLLFVKIQMH